MKTKSSQKTKSKSLITNLRESTLFLGVAGIALVVSVFVFVMPIFAIQVEEKIIFSDHNSNIISVNPDGSGYQIIGAGSNARISPHNDKIVFVNGACGLDL